MGAVLSDQEINQLQMQANVMLGDPTGFHRIARIVEKAAIEADRQRTNEWRKLALQFDSHRMQAIGHLKAIVDHLPVDMQSPIRNFLSATPDRQARGGDQRAAFESWLRVKPCGAAHDFAWEAWQARAAYQSQDREDAAFEAVRKKLCRLPRYSFMSLNDGVRRVPDSSGNWLEFDQVHALFDPVAIDAARRIEGEG